MFSRWFVVECLASFIDDCDKLRLAETSQRLLRLLRVHCVLDNTVFDLGSETGASRLIESGWNLAQLKGHVAYCGHFSKAQRNAVTVFEAEEPVTDLRFAQFPNLTGLDSKRETTSELIDLSQLKRLVVVRVFCSQENQHSWQKLELPPVLRVLRLVGVGPQAESSTLLKLTVVKADLDVLTDPPFSFPALREVELLHCTGAENCVCFLPETLTSLSLFAKSTDCRELLRFRRLRTIVLKTKLHDREFCEFVSQLPGTLQHIDFFNTSKLRCKNLTFSSFGRMSGLRTLMLKRVGGFLDMNDLRNCHRLRRMTLKAMDRVANIPKDTQTIWPRLTQFKLTLVSCE